jgi:hypothetical protein
MPIPKLRPFNDIESPECFYIEQKLSDAKKIYDILFKHGYYCVSIWDVVFCWDKYSEDRCAGWMEIPEDENKLIEIINSKLKILEDIDFNEFIEFVEKNT